MQKAFETQQHFNNQMRIYENNHTEKKFISMQNYTNGPLSVGYLGEIPAVSLPNAGLTGNDVGLSGVVIQTGETLTNAATAINNLLGSDLCTPVGGYKVSNNLGAVGHIIGNYAQFKSTHMNINVNLDPIGTPGASDQQILSQSMPRGFRLIQVKAKRQASVSGGAATDQGSLAPAIQANLFINEINQEVGLLDPMSVQDAFTFLINRQKFQVLKDERFSLVPQSFATKSGSSVRAASTNVPQIGRSQRFKKYWLPVPKNKTKFDPAHAAMQPLDFNYITFTILLCRSIGGSGQYDSRGWNVQVNGASSIIDV